MLATAAMLVRLSRGPISLDFLTSYVIASLEPEDGAFRVSVAATELVWPRWYDVDLSVRDVKCTDASGTTIASMSSLAMDLSASALLRGVIAPRQIKLAGPQLALVREENGEIDFGLGLDSTEAGGESVFAKLFSATSDGGAAPAAKFLRSVTVSDGVLSLLDRRTGFRTKADAVTLDMTRAKEQIDVQLSTAVELGTERIPLQTTVAHGASSGTQVQLSFSALEPAAALKTAHVLNPPPGSVAATILEAATYFRLPLSGTINLALDAAGSVESVKVDASATTGVIALPPPVDQKLTVERVALAVTYDAAEDAVELQHLEVDLGEPEVRVTGKWTSKDAGALAIDAQIIQLSTDSIGGYWPPTAAVSARTWVTGNISNGSVRDATVTLRGALVPDDPSPFTLRELGGRFTFEGLTVRYLDTMPVAAGVGGTASFSTDGFDFHVASGKVAGLVVPTARVVISGISGKVPRIAIDAQSRGAVRDALTVVDAEPLHYAHEIGIDPQSVSGTMNGRVKFAFPLAGAPRPHDLGVSVQAELQDTGFPHAVGDWALSAGDLDLAVAADVLSISGTAQVQGVPCDVHWREELGATSGVTRRVDVESRVDAEGRAALGFDMRPWLTGPASVSAHIEQQHDGKGTGSLGIDLDPATIDAPNLRLVKAPGASARADLSLALTGSKITSLSAFTFTAPEAYAHGKATIGSGKARIANLTMDGVLPPAGPGDPSPQFVLTLQPATQGNRFELTSNDASTLLRLLMPDGRTQGGRLTFGGTIDLEATGLPFAGDLAIRSFTLTKSPVLARLLMLSSMSGILSTFQGRGLAVDELTSHLSYAAKAATFKDGSIDGPSVRLLFSGTIDGAKNDVTMDGTLIPSFYGLNAAAGKVPLIGGLFGGGDGEGVIAIDFTLRGPLTDPKIAVKPSSMAPGVLRRFARGVPW